MTQEDVYKPSCRRKDLFDRRKNIPPRAMARGGMFYPVAASRRESRRTASREKSRR